MWKKEKALICAIDSILPDRMDRVHSGNRGRPGKAKRGRQRHAALAPSADQANVRHKQGGERCLPCQLPAGRKAVYCLEVSRNISVEVLIQADQGRGFSCIFIDSVQAVGTAVHKFHASGAKQR